MEKGDEQVGFALDLIAKIEKRRRSDAIGQPIEKCLLTCGHSQAKVERA